MITVKLARDCPAEQNSLTTVDVRYELARWLMSEGIMNARKVYIADFGCKLHSDRTEGRAVV